MTRTSIRKCWTLLAFAASISLACFGVASAGSIDYGDFMGTSVWYRNVIEDSGTDPVPLYGVPSIGGNTLDFDPVSFNSFSSGAGASDITDGALTMMIETKDDLNFIHELLYEEAGDFTLLGFGGAGTFASVSSNFFVDVEAINGVPIDPIKLEFSMVFNPNGGQYDQASLGGGPVNQDNWSGELMIHLVDELNALGVDGANMVSKVSVTLNNTLATISEDGTSSYIAKKDFGGTSITVFVPEPSSMVLVLIGLIGLFGCRKRSV